MLAFLALLGDATIVDVIQLRVNLTSDALFPEPSICLSKVLVNEPPPGSPTGAPMERVAHFQSLLSHVSPIPQ